MRRDSISTIFSLENSKMMLLLLISVCVPDIKDSYDKLESIWQALSVAFNTPCWLLTYQASSLN